MSIDQIKVVLERIDNLQSTVDRIDRDLEHDRRDLQEFAIRVGALETQIDEMRKSMTSFATKVGDRVEDMVTPVATEMNELKETIKEKKMLVIEKKGKSLLRRIFRR